ncbi:MAG: acetate kinase [Clostridiales bacterium]|jgi:acetate kinase|nr:acetate kinase [Clostridiales bacterium]
MKILVMNCGSSSLKYQLIDMTGESVLAKGLCERIGIEGSVLKHAPAGKAEFVCQRPMKDHTDAVTLVLDALTDASHGVVKSAGEIIAVGHRVVHGGEFFSASVLINSEVKAAVKECCALAPLHNPANLIGIDACEKLIAGKPQAAVFDTAFHQTMPPKAYLYAIPYELYEKYKIRKYGFHGTSHMYVSRQAAKMLDRPVEELKTVTCHLGNGASICAVDGGKSADTSMGFTPLQGLAMGTRSGDIDPAVVSFLIEKEGMTAKEVENLLNKKSGMAGLSGVGSDFRDLDAAVEKGDERAKAALDLFYYRVAQYVGAYAAAMNGLDAIVFTAGIGENSAIVRESVCQYLGFLGVAVDSAANKQRGKAADISKEGAAVRVLVVPTNEELVIARDTLGLIE